jgi:hypothetical protein
VFNWKCSPYLPLPRCSSLREKFEYLRQMARKTSDVRDYSGNFVLSQSWRTVREFYIARLDIFRAIIINVCACIAYMLLYMITFRANASVDL